MIGIPSLARLARGRPRPSVGNRCDLCASEITENHRHLIDLDQRGVRCACAACVILFASQSNSRYRPIPERVRRDPAFDLSETTWTNLQIPVRIAFVFRNSVLAQWVAIYPSPAGPVESMLPLDAWTRIADNEPLVRTLAPDVEAILVYGRRFGGSLECLLVPIDTCYALVGVVRRHWRGLDGGERVWRELNAMVDALRTRSQELNPLERKGGNE